MSYIGNRPENDAVINHIEYVATAGQTLFPVVYDSYVEVYLNGVRLAEDDFVKNNNVSISLVVGATAGDIVAVSGYQKVKSDSVASTDNAIARFDGANGTLQNSDVFVDDSGNFSSSANVSGKTIKAIDTVNGAMLYLRYLAGYNRIDSYNSPITEARPMVINMSSLKFTVNDTAKLDIDTSGNVLVTGSGGLGYGAGSGGSVTQLTSKSTAVTLNKPCGQIITHDASLAAGASAVFVFNNSMLNAKDTLVVALGGGVASANTYKCWVGYTSHVSGVAYINLENRSNGALAQAVQINFAIIKGATE